MMSLKKASRTKSLSLSEDFPLRPQKARSILPAVGGIPLTTRKPEDTGKILKYIDDSIIGKGVAFLGPFGRRKVVYADYASSGRSLQFLEDYINKEVLPAYGDISCTSAVTGLQSYLYKKEAREIIRTAVNATDEDEILFCEETYASPSERLCYMLCYQNENLRCKRSTNSKLTDCPVLFVSTNESTQSLLPWQNAGVQIVKVSKNREGFLDLVDLEKKLSSYSESRRLLIGLFSGASRLTGILSDDVATTILLHQYGALSIWDYSSTAPFASTDMNPTLPGAAKDAVFFSTKKFVGGVQGPGVLIMKKSLITSLGCATDLCDTAGVVSAVRAGLVVQLKESIGAANIIARQEKLCKQILAHIRTIPEIVLLGSMQTSGKRIPTLCFLVKHPRGTFLHNRFVVAVLNDVFGIQATAGSQINEALGITRKLAVDYELLLSDDQVCHEYIRPGYTRVTLPFFMSDAEVAFILEALKMVATEAWKLLPQYDIEERTGEWRHHSNSLVKERKCLSTIRYTDGKMVFSDRRISGPGVFPTSYSDCLQTARNLFNRSRKMAQKSVTIYSDLKLKSSAAESLRWYMLPGEAHELLVGHSQNVKTSVPFDPNRTKVQETPSILHMLRHNSLSALDIRRFKSRSLPTSPVQIPMKRQTSSPTPSESPRANSLAECISPPVVRFSLGGEVTTMAAFSSPRMTNLANSEEAISSRNSTCSDCTEEIQAYVAEVTKELATEIKSEIREVISKVEDVLENTDTMDMSSINMSSITNLSAAEDLRSDSVSATDVAEYLKEFSKEMASEVKSEIREVVNTMSDIIPTDCSITCSSFLKKITSTPEIVEDRDTTDAETNNKIAENHRYSDSSDTSKNDSIDDSNKLRSESFPRPNSTPGWHHPTAPSPETSTPTCPYTGAISKLIDPNSTASQDSGINMCFQDLDETRTRTISENVSESKGKAITKRSQSDSAQGSQTNYSHRTNSNRSSNSETSDEAVLRHTNCDCKIEKVNRTSSPLLENVTSNNHRQQRAPAYTRRLPSESDSDQDFNKWHHLPKDLWKQTAEAIDEFDMLREGDRILVCLSGSSASLCLLHALRQFSRARGIHIEMAAVTVGKCGVDPRALMLYMRDINMELFIEQLNASETFRSKITSVARRKNYNVLAMGNTLDKVADDFLASVLQKGKLYTPQAHSTNREGDLRIIRPFIFVRERFIEDFAIQKNLPTRPSTTLGRPYNASNSILKVQEAVNPGVYDNIKNALRPLLSTRLETNKTSYEYLKMTFASRD